MSWRWLRRWTHPETEADRQERAELARAWRLFLALGVLNIPIGIANLVSGRDWWLGALQLAQAIVFTAVALILRRARRQTG